MSFFIKAGVVGFNNNINTSAPNSVIPVSFFSAIGAAASIDAMIGPKGPAGSLLAQIPDNTAVGGNKRGSQAVDLQLARSAATQVASGSGAMIMGSTNTGSGTRAIAFGFNNNVSNSDSGALGSGNTVAGANSFAFGDANVASGSQSFSAGQNNTSSGNDSTTLGFNNTASGNYSSVHGGHSATTRGISGAECRASAGIFGTLGDSQRGRYIVHRATANAAATVLTSDNGGPTAANSVTLPNNSTYVFDGKCVARNTATGELWSAKFEGAIKRGVNAASTTLVGAPVVTVIANDAAMAALTLTAQANVANGSLEFSVTGIAATNIQWVLDCETVECTA